MTDGLHCKACDAPLHSEDSDRELCRDCLFVVLQYNKDLVTEDDLEDWLDINLVEEVSNDSEGRG